MKTESVTKTVVCGLETSNRKNGVLEGVIEDWQRISEHLANIATGFDQGKLHGKPSALYRRAGDIEGTDIHSNGRLSAAQKVSDAFVSWQRQPQNNDHPKSEFGDGDYCRFTNQAIELEKNEKFAVKVSLIPYNPEWFTLKYGAEQAKILEEIQDGERKIGAFEIHYNDGHPQLHLATTEEVEVLEPDEVETAVGIDLGENVLYALGTVGSEKTATLKSGAEFRHHREKLSSRKDKLQEKGKLRKVKEISGERLKYTDWVTHTASRSIVDEARQFEKPMIVLEDLTGYRQQKGEYAIHDWPYAEIQEKVMYKAKEEGIPVVKVNPAYTSQTCNKCGEQNTSWRDGNEWKCGACDYEVHADVNAAFNIAERGFDQKT